MAEKQRKIAEDLMKKLLHLDFLESLPIRISGGQPTRIGVSGLADQELDLMDDIMC